MKTEVSPVVMAIVIAVVVIVGGFFIWKFTGGKSFTKEEASGRLEIKPMDIKALGSSGR